MGFSRGRGSNIFIIGFSENSVLRIYAMKDILRIVQEKNNIILIIHQTQAYAFSVGITILNQ